ncbi:MAG TPA: hypothetical protein PK037_13485, partial [Saprospiraceae bacterium]|nr:hypothetical protein [Saprospiraceae bacterium]
MKNIVFLTLFVLPFLILAQNVGVNNSNPDNSAQLDITSASKGLLIPRMTEAARLAIVNPAHSLMVYQTDGQYGYYYNNGSTVSPSWLALGTSLNTWAIGGNTLNATGAFGSKSNNHVDFLSNNVVRGRLTNLGEFFVGATNTTIAGDLLGAVGNSTFPFAVNGYSSFNGCGVYGAITGGTTTFAAVQGEYQSAASGPYNTAGVKGSNQSSVPGTAFRSLSASGPRVGVFGNTTNANGQYTFGVHGSMGSSDIRCGGVIGDDFGFALGALGYYAASLTDYSVYGFGNAYQVGVAGGRTSAPEPNTQIGLGIYGGVMGGWIRGLVYGTHLKGEIYGLYVDGKTYTNQPIAELVATDAEARVPVYTAVSSQPEVYDKGKATTVGGAGKVEFNEIFRSMADFDDV